MSASDSLADGGAQPGSDQAGTDQAGTDQPGTDEDTGRYTGRRTGGCLCGAVRYEVAWPPGAIVVCHCADCQKQAGTTFSLVGISRRDGLKVSGDLATFTHPGSSGQPVNRRFCGNCGSPVLTDTEAARAQGIIFFKAGTLDDTAGLSPSVHYWTASAQDWFVLPPGVTCLKTQ